MKSFRDEWTAKLDNYAKENQAQRDANPEPVTTTVAEKSNPLFYYDDIPTLAVSTPSENENTLNENELDNLSQNLVNQSQLAPEHKSIDQKTRNEVDGQEVLIDFKDYLETLKNLEKVNNDYFALIVANYIYPNSSDWSQNQSSRRIVNDFENLSRLAEDELKTNKQALEKECKEKFTNKINDQLISSVVGLMIEIAALIASQKSHIESLQKKSPVVFSELDSFNIEARLNIGLYNKLTWECQALVGGLADIFKAHGFINSSVKDVDEKKVADTQSQSENLVNTDSNTQSQVKNLVGANSETQSQKLPDLKKITHELTSSILGKNYKVDEISAALNGLLIPELKNVDEFVSKLDQKIFYNVDKFKLYHYLDRLEKAIKQVNKISSVIEMLKLKKEISINDLVKDRSNLPLIEKIPDLQMKILSLINLINEGIRNSKINTLPQSAEFTLTKNEVDEKILEVSNSLPKLSALQDAISLLSYNEDKSEVKALQTNLEGVLQSLDPLKLHRKDKDKKDIPFLEQEDIFSGAIDQAVPFVQDQERVLEKSKARYINLESKINGIDGTTKGIQLCHAEMLMLIEKLILNVNIAKFDETTFNSFKGFSTAKVELTEFNHLFKHILSDNFLSSIKQSKDLQKVWADNLEQLKTYIASVDTNGSLRAVQAQYVKLIENCIAEIETVLTQQAKVQPNVESIKASDDDDALLSHLDENAKKYQSKPAQIKSFVDEADKEELILELKNHEIKQEVIDRIVSFLFTDQELDVKLGEELVSIIQGEMSKDELSESDIIRYQELRLLMQKRSQREKSQMKILAKLEEEISSYQDVESKMRGKKILWQIADAIWSKVLDAKVKLVDTTKANDSIDVTSASYLGTAASVATNAGSYVWSYVPGVTATESKSSNSTSNSVTNNNAEDGNEVGQEESSNSSYYSMFKSYMTAPATTTFSLPYLDSVATADLTQITEDLISEKLQRDLAVKKAKLRKDLAAKKAKRDIESNDNATEKGKDTEPFIADVDLALQEAATLACKGNFDCKEAFDKIKLLDPTLALLKENELVKDYVEDLTKAESSNDVAQLVFLLKMQLVDQLPQIAATLSEDAVAKAKAKRDMELEPIARRRALRLAASKYWAERAKQPCPFEIKTSSDDQSMVQGSVPQSDWDVKLSQSVWNLVLRKPAQTAVPQSSYFGSLVSSASLFRSRPSNTSSSGENSKHSSSNSITEINPNTLQNSKVETSANDNCSSVNSSNYTETINNSNASPTNNNIDTDDNVAAALDSWLMQAVNMVIKEHPVCKIAFEKIKANDPALDSFKKHEKVAAFLKNIAEAAELITLSTLVINLKSDLIVIIPQIAETLAKPIEISNVNTVGNSINMDNGSTSSSVYSGLGSSLLSWWNSKPEQTPKENQASMKNFAEIGQQPESSSLVFGATKK